MSYSQYYILLFQMIFLIWKVNHLVALFTVHCAQRQCVRINNAYTSVLITPNVAAPSKTQQMTFLSLFLCTINHP